MPPKILAVLAALLLAVAAGCSPKQDSSTPESARSTGAPAAMGAINLPQAYTSVVASVIDPPMTPFPGTDSKYHVAYDVVLSNASRVPANIESIEVVDAANTSRVVAGFSGQELLDRMRGLFGFPDRVEDLTIPPSAGRIVYVDFAAESAGAIPPVAAHRLKFAGSSGPASRVPVPVEYVIAPHSLSAGPLRVLQPPLKGNNWVALNGCCLPETAHRVSDAPINGSISNGQRFAIDYKRFDDSGAFYQGDRTRNESYVDYGAEILAVADGTVVATLDTEEPNVPGILPASDPERAAKITIDNVDGNHIIIDLGGGAFAFYAHLVKGSLKVKVGDKVRAGEVIAALGNTGNSNASHLHFHLMDGPSLGSRGIPYVIGAFEFAGEVPQEVFEKADDYLSGNFGSGRIGKPEPRKGELPLNLAVVNFPA